MKRKLLTTNLLVTGETFFFFLIRPKEKIMLANIEKIIDKERETAEVSNTIFSNIVGNLDIVENSNCRSSCSKVFCYRGVLKLFTKLREKLLLWSLFFIKSQTPCEIL